MLYVIMYPKNPYGPEIDITPVSLHLRWASILMIFEN